MKQGQNRMVAALAVGRWSVSVADLSKNESTPGSDVLRGILWPVGTGLVTIAAYLSWLRWHDQDYYYDAAVGANQGPYHPWQVVGLAVTLGLVALIGGWLKRPGTTTLVMTVVLVIVWSLDNSYEPGPGPNTNMWPVGAMFLAVGSVFGFGLMALLGMGLRRLTERFQRRQGNTPA